MTRYRIAYEKVQYHKILGKHVDRACT